MAKSSTASRGPVLSREDIDRLQAIKTFPQLVKYLRDDLDWPIDSDNTDDLTFDYAPEELGLDAKSVVKIKEIKQLRPLTSDQPWGIFFVNFEPKKLPVVVLRRILRALVVNKRGLAKSSTRSAWNRHDLLFISTYGEGDERAITFAHFADAPPGHETDLPTLKVLGWDDQDTPLHLDKAHASLRAHLRWPGDDKDAPAWRDGWARAFTVAHGEVVRTSKDLAVRLADLAARIRKRARTVLRHESEKGELRTLHKAFREALIHDLSEDDFADMYAQTIAYGLLTAAVSRHAPDAPGVPVSADSAVEMVPVTNPFLKEMLERFLKAGGRNGHAAKSPHKGIDFDELGVSEVVDLLRTANMDAVLRDFGNKNPLEDPVIHFYELFLKEYDPKKRMQRGVFYTPRPVVSFIVRSVHEILQREFGLEDGLASTITWSEMVARAAPSPATGGGGAASAASGGGGVSRPLTIPPGTNPNSDFIQILDPATGTGTFLVEVIDTIHKTLVDRWKREGKNAAQIKQLWNQYVPAHLLPRLHGYELMPAPYAIAHMKIGLKLHETGYGFGSEERVRVYLTNALDPAHDFSDRLAFEVPALAHEAQAVNAVKRNQLFTLVMGNPPYSYMSANLSESQRDLVEPYRFVDGVRIRERGALQFELNLQDDYVKFIRLTEMLIERAGVGVAGLITNNAYLGNVTFRGLRSHLLKTFSSVSFVNLHGSLKAGIVVTDGVRDENVFDIQQGVAIAMLRRDLIAARGRVEYADVLGPRTEKYPRLAGPIGNVGYVSMQSCPPDYLFLPRDEVVAAEYERGLPIDTVFVLSSTGIMTNRDGLAIAESDAELDRRMHVFLDPRRSDIQVAAELGLSDNVVWALSEARSAISRAEWHGSIAAIDYRPFDCQRIVYHPAIVGNLRRPVMSQLSAFRNVALLTCRQQITPGFQHVFATRRMFECCLVSLKSREKTSGFPLFIEEQSDLHGRAHRANLSPSAVRALLANCPPEKSQTEVDRAHALFFIAYAELHSATYRKRYQEFLQRAFPRIFAPANAALFKKLADLGEELVSLHLLESSKCKATGSMFVGDGNPEVERATWSSNAIWLDKAQTRGFRGVPESVWNFHIGGYQVCEKWLKDRKGRTLSKDDIAHYQKIVVALSETIRIMAEIDKVIDEHGGWPGAFVTDAPVPQSAAAAAPTGPPTSPPDGAKEGPTLPFV